VRRSCPKGDEHGCEVQRGYILERDQLSNDDVNQGTGLKEATNGSQRAGVTIGGYSEDFLITVTHAGDLDLAFA
jgi:hypothetical protein